MGDVLRRFKNSVCVRDHSDGSIYPNLSFVCGFFGTDRSEVTRCLTPVVGKFNLSFFCLSSHLDLDGYFF